MSQLPKKKRRIGDGSSSWSFFVPPDAPDVIPDIRFVSSANTSTQGAFSGYRTGRKRQQAQKPTTSHHSKTADSTFVTPENVTTPTETIADVLHNFQNMGIDHNYLDHLEERSQDTTSKARVRPKGDEALHEWMSHLDHALQEIITLDGRGHAQSELCRSCSRLPGEYDCMSCCERALRCGTCIKESHKSLFVHRIRKWNGQFFEASSLYKLGLRIQLGHPLGDVCVNPVRCSRDDFTVLSLSGVERVGFDFCECGQGSQTHAIQLLRAQIFPATFINPQTGASFECLRFFELISYESKLTAFEFYRTIERLTDNTGTVEMADKYPSFLRLVHLFRQLRMLKRSGRGHDTSGINGTKPGECSVLCPACPQIGINMKPGWESEGPENAFLHSQFVALDANFRLKRKNVSSDKADPGLSRGWSYFVEELSYKEYLGTFQGDKQPKSSCSNHQAIQQADAKRGSNGHAATGMATVDCSRHNMKRPQSVGDLQYGERYCNMDYLFYHSIRNSGLKTFTISYDIACQWSINLQERMKKFEPDFFLFQQGVSTNFLVPKFHLPAHVASCQTRYNFNFTPGAARTDGEAPERGWADANPLAPSTREMGPGSRRDTMDCHFGDINWKKITYLGPTFRRKFLASACDMAEYTIAHQQLTAGVGGETAKKWDIQVAKWEADNSLPNPYEVSGDTTTLTMASVRRQLAQEEAEALKKGASFSLDTEITPFVLISAGIDLEAEQRNVRAKASEIWEHAQDRQHTRLLLAGNALKRKIEAWWKFQDLYFPAGKLLRQEKLDSGDDIPAHSLPLILPSSVGKDVPIDGQLREVERQIREAQAFETLEMIRSQLRLRACLYTFKECFVRGQGPNTRARTAISVVETRINGLAEQYRIARKALEALSKVDPLKYPFKGYALKELAKEDIRPINQKQEESSDGRAKMSWIWQSLPKPQEGESESVTAYYHEQLRIEWCKSRARQQRFTEEVMLLREEMSRVIRFFTWKVNFWTSKADESANIANSNPITGCDYDSAWAEGHRAYALRQANMYQNMTAYCISLWSILPDHLTRMQHIIKNPGEATPEDFSGKPRGTVLDSKRKEVIADK